MMGMVGDEDKAATPPTVAELYRRGVHLTEEAVSLMGDPDSERNVARAQAYAAIAQALFTGVQAAAHAMLALGVVGEMDDVLTQEAQTDAVANWYQVVETSVGR